MSETPDATLPKSVGWLGYGGLSPFLGLALLVAFDPLRRAFWNQALIAYGAVILSFVGALHWAFAMLLQELTPAQRRNRFVWSTLPALLAWPALLLPSHFAAPLLVAGFLAHYWQDRALASYARLPSWYLPLRLHLSTVACMALASAALLAGG